MRVFAWDSPRSNFQTSITNLLLLVMLESSKQNKKIDELAWQIWLAKGEPIPVQDSEARSELETALRTGILIEDENGVNFSSESFMAEAAARHFVSSNLSDLIESPQHCFERLHGLWIDEIRTGAVSGNVLALLHNSGKIDAFSWGQQAIQAGNHVFDVLHVFDGAISHFSDASSLSIASFFIGHYEKVKNDLAGGMLYRRFDPWFATHPQIAEEVRQLHLQSKQEGSTGIFSSSMRGLVLNDFSTGFKLIIESVKSEDYLVSRPAIHALGLIDFGDPSRTPALDEAVEVCSRVIDRPTDSAFSMAVRTLGRLVVYDEKIVNILNRAVHTGIPEAMYEISDFLFLNVERYQEKSWFWPLLRTLAAVKFRHKVMHSNIDYLLGGWIVKEFHRPKVMEFLDVWISHRDEQDLQQGGIEAAFPGTVVKLAQQSNLLTLTITRWLLNDGQRFPIAASKLISYLHAAGKNSLHFDRTTLDELSTNEFRFLIRRILGYLSGDEILITAVFSLVHTLEAEQRTFGFVRQALVSHIGYDYPSKTIEYLKIQKNLSHHGESIKELCTRVISELESRAAAIRALPNLKELHMPFIKARRFEKERRRQINEALEKAEEESIWSRLATRVPLKAGCRSFQKLGGQYTVPMELKEISHSVPIPGSEITDPTWSARERRLFQMAKRDDP